MGAKTKTVILNELFVFGESAHGQWMPGLGPDRHIFPLWDVEEGSGKKQNETECRRQKQMRQNSRSIVTRKWRIIF